MTMLIVSTLYFTKFNETLTLSNVPGFWDQTEDLQLKYGDQMY